MLSLGGAQAQNSLGKSEPQLLKEQRAGQGPSPLRGTWKAQRVGSRPSLSCRVDRDYRAGVKKGKSRTKKVVKARGLPSTGWGLGNEGFL